MQRTACHLPGLRMVFKTGKREDVRTIKGDLKVNIRKAKEKYRWKLEWKLHQKNMRLVFSGHH